MAAQIAVIRDLQKFDAAFPGYILAMADGTSLRVSCQRIGRKFTGKDIPANRKAVVEHLMGLRAKASRTPSGIPLPNGQKFFGTDVDMYQNAYFCALVEIGTPEDVALMVSRNVKL
jgi:hypothetical protein